jgi:signal transduction histidine kinase
MKGWRLKISIRYKMLLVILAALVFTLGTHLYLATTLFKQDKLAYVYDLNSALVESLSEQTRSSLSVLVKELNLFVRDIHRPESAAELFKQERDLVRIEIYGPGGARRGAHVNHKILDQVGLTPDDLERIRKERPLPLEALLAKGGHLHVQNSSLPPDAAILTLAVAYPGEEPLVVAVDFRHERLLRIFGRSKIHETYLVDERGEILAHPDPRKVLGRADLSGHTLVKEALEAKVERGVKEFLNQDGAAFLGAYARVGIGRLAVLTQLPKDEALRATHDLIYRSALFGIAILIAAFIASVFFSRLLTAPIRRLRAATSAIGEGRFDIKVGVKSRDEIGDLARSFEDMAEALKQTQAQLVRSEKMAAFGQLGAGITHEVKNPMTGIVGFAQLGQLSLDDQDKIKEMFELIEGEAKRCNEILVNFLKFARADTKKHEAVQPNRVVEEAAKICNHQLMINKVKLDMKLDPNAPPIMGNAAELQQVLLNLAINAQQAMPGGGRVRMSTGRDADGFATISVADDGPGIPKDAQEKIFEPFFTTKAPGEGTGLGLSIVFGIVRDHQGTVSVKSKQGKGTIFTIRLPAAAGKSTGGKTTGGEGAS